jgi:hypothetical protein
MIETSFNVDTSLFFLLWYLGFFCSNHKHLLITLVRLEFLVLALFVYVYFCVCLIMNSILLYCFCFCLFVRDL